MGDEVDRRPATPGTVASGTSRASDEAGDGVDGTGSVRASHGLAFQGSVDPELKGVVLRPHEQTAGTDIGDAVAGIIASVGETAGIGSLAGVEPSEERTLDPAALPDRTFHGRNTPSSAAYDLAFTGEFRGPGGDRVLHEFRVFRDGDDGFGTRPITSVIERRIDDGGDRPRIREKNRDRIVVDVDPGIENERVLKNRVRRYLDGWHQSYVVAAMAI